MTRNDIKALIEAFVDYVTNENPKSDQELLDMIDRIMVAQQHAQYDFDGHEDLDKPVQVPTYEVLRQRVSIRFPDYGLYNIPYHVTTEIMESQLTVGDAIDDIADACRDFMEILDQWDRNSADVALWLFVRGYRVHWGPHLRELQFYLNARILEADA